MNVRDAIANAQESLSRGYANRLAKTLDNLGLQRKGEGEANVALYVGLFSAGLLSGLALTLLLTPRSGSEIRHTVKRSIPRFGGDTYEEDDYELPRYDFEKDRFRNVDRRTSSRIEE